MASSERPTSFNLSPSTRTVLRELAFQTGKTQTDIVEEGILLLDEMKRTGQDAASLQKQKSLQLDKSSIESLISEKLSERDRIYLSHLLANSEVWRDTLARQILGIAQSYHQHELRGKTDQRTH